MRVSDEPKTRAIQNQKEDENVLSLIFVYNAHSGTRNAFLDTMHKVLSPATYQCKLCEITFGLVSEKQLWKKFRTQSNHRFSFLHKDEFAKVYASKFGHKFSFPIVLLESGKDLEVLISTEELNQLKTARQLIDLIENRI